MRLPWHKERLPWHKDQPDPPLEWFVEVYPEHTAGDEYDVADIHVIVMDKPSWGWVVYTRPRSRLKFDWADTREQAIADALLAATEARGERDA